MDNAEPTGISSQENLASLFVSQGDRINSDVIGQVFEDFVPGIVEVLLSFFQTPCSIKLSGFRDDTFQSICAGGSCLVTELTLPDDAEPVIVAMPHQTVFALIGVMFGEDEAAAPYAPNRALTNIEIHIGGEIARATVESLFHKVFGELDLKGEASHTLDWNSDEVEYDISQQRFFSEFQIAIGEREPTLLYIGCPSSIASELQEQWTAQNSAPDASTDVAPDAYWSQQIKNHIDGASVEIVASVTCPDTTLGVIADLKPGNVLEIYQTNDSLITLECDEEPIFRGSLGKSGGRFAVEVEATVDHWGEFLCELLVEADKSS